MSGGAYDYAYHRVEDFAEALKASTHPFVGDWECRKCGLPPSKHNMLATKKGRQDRGLREETAAFLFKVADLMREIEWEDSGDGGAWVPLATDLLRGDWR